MTSDRWVNWVSVIDFKSCYLCKNNNGKIRSKWERQPNYPPVHDKCRCAIVRMKALLAGTATDMGTNGADWYLKYLKRLPPYYISKLSAKYKGWISKLFNLAEVAPGRMIGGDEYKNVDGKLPSNSYRKWYEADINYTGGMRNTQRILYSNDGLIFVTYDHYTTFIEII